MNKWLALLGAVRKGAILTNPKGWKTAQVVVTGVVAALTSAYAFAVAAGWLPGGLDDQIVNIGTGVGTLLFGAYNIYSTVATTEKIGLKAKPGGGPGGDDAFVVRAPEGQVRGGQMSADTRRRARRPGERDPGPFLDGGL